MCRSCFKNAQHIGTTSVPKAPDQPTMSHMCGNDFQVAKINNPATNHVSTCQTDGEASLTSFKKESKGRPLIMAVMGKSGVGKSKFIQNFCELEDCITGDGANPTTKEVTLYETVKHSVFLQVIDTPGLADIVDERKKVSRDLSQITDKKADVLFYCISMKGSRIDSADVMIIKILTEAFGVDIWRHTILLLTFANYRQEMKEDQFAELVKVYAAEFERALCHANIFGIPVRSVFALEGTACIPAIPIGDDPNTSIPLCANWSNQLLIEVVKRSDVQTQRNLLQLKGVDFNEIAEKVGSVAAGAAVGAAFGTAIGAPFFGAGAAIGASVGAVVGGTTGAAAPSFVTKLRNKYRLWKVERQHNARK